MASPARDPVRIAIRLDDQELYQGELRPIAENRQPPIREFKAQVKAGSHKVAVVILNPKTDPNEADLTPITEEDRKTVGELVPVDPRIVAGVKMHVQLVTRSMGGDLAWPGLLRKLDRLDLGGLQQLEMGQLATAQAAPQGRSASLDRFVRFIFGNDGRTLVG